jgi:hypothetical protein
MNLHIYTHIYMYVYICIYIHIYIYTYIYIYIWKSWPELYLSIVDCSTLSCVYKGYVYIDINNEW